MNSQRLKAMEVVRYCEQCGTQLPRFSTKSRHFCSPCGIARYSRGYRKARKPDQLAAHAEVAKAVSQGLIPPATERRCMDCLAPATEYDHRDYRYPLMVDPVCHRCNIRRGPAIEAVR